MSTQIQRRRGTTAEHSTFTGALAETTIDTDKDTVVVHDGTTVGGHPLMRENGSNSALALGSAGTPSLKFTGDTNTGIYSPGADQVAISTNGTGRLTIDSSGNVNIDSGTVYVDAANNRLGVGTTSPGALLDVAGTIQSSGTTAIRTVQAVSNAGTLSLNSRPDISSHIIDASDNPLLVRTLAAQPLSFHTNSSERLRITSDGKVGVGTSSPQDILSVAATASANTKAGTFYFATAGNIGDQNSIVIGTATTSLRGIAIAAEKVNVDNAHSLVFKTSSSSAEPSERMRITNSGLVGIGTSAPGYKLDVNGEVAFSPNTAGKNTFYFTTNASNDASLFLKSDTTNKVNIQANGPSYFNGGSVGIGSDAPAEMLTVGTNSVGGNLRINSSSAGNNGLLRFYASDSAEKLQFFVSTTESICYTPASIPLAFQVGGSERARIDSSGRLLVGTSSARSNLYVSNTNITPLAQTEASGSTYSNGLSLLQYSSAGYAPVLTLGTSASNTAGTNTVTANGSDFGIINFVGNDGTNFRSGAQIYASRDAAPGTGMPGRLSFSTTADGAYSPTEAFRINSLQKPIFLGPTIRCVQTYNSTTANAANQYVDSAGDFYRSTSSVKYKTNVETIEDQYSDALLQCRPVWYQSVCEADNADWGYWGFIAEEVAQIDPRLCFFKEEENGTLEPEGVQYDRFVPHLLNLIKRQKEQIEAMEARLTALESA